MIRFSFSLTALKKRSPVHYFGEDEFAAAKPTGDDSATRLVLSISTSTRHMPNLLPVTMSCSRAQASTLLH